MDKITQSQAQVNKIQLEIEKNRRLVVFLINICYYNAATKEIENIKRLEYKKMLFLLEDL